MPSKNPINDLSAIQSQIEQLQTLLTKVQNNGVETEGQLNALIKKETELLKEKLKLQSKAVDLAAKAKDMFTDQAKIFNGPLLKGAQKLDAQLRRLPMGDKLADLLQIEKGIGRMTQALGDAYVKNKMAGLSSFKAIMNAGKMAFAMITRAIAATGIGLLVLAAAALLKLFAANEKKVQRIRMEFGVTEKSARGLNLMLSKNGKLRDQQLGTLTAMSSELGFMPKVTKYMVADVTKLTRQFKLSNDEAGQLLAYTLATGQNVSEFNSQLESVLDAENKRNTIQVDARSVTKDLVKLSAGVRMQYKGQTAELIKQVAITKRIGINFERARSVALGFLDIGSSLESQFTLEALTGQSFNLDKTRALALNDPAKAVQSVIDQFGPFLRNANLLEQEAFASAAGLSFDELSKAVEMQEIAASHGSEAVAAKLEELRTPQEKIQDAVIGIQDAILKKIVPALDRMARSRLFGGKGRNSVAAEATEVDDFILRPGKPPIKFNKDDLLIGGTSLSGNSGETNALLKELIVAVRQSGTITLDRDKVNESLSIRSVPEGLS